MEVNKAVDISTDPGLSSSLTTTHEGTQIFVSVNRDKSGSAPSVNKGKAKTFVVELRLCFPDRFITVKDSAIWNAKVARALITYMALLKDLESLQCENSIDLGMLGF